MKSLYDDRVYEFRMNAFEKIVPLMRLGRVSGWFGFTRMGGYATPKYLGTKTSDRDEELKKHGLLND
jgi:hypothetical protein